ncbi:GMC family oxidoreductase [Kitasatospora sp. NPDC052896]|uniref:GMC family oxidoreductase n=1 Tax=Kitasatospora sp. NPDC052896 TaxID=3364061 RepID=UPI0037C83DE5
MTPHSPDDRARWDAIVVGAGFAGSLIAKRLGDQGWRVLVLEAGPGDRREDPVRLRATAADTYRAADRKVITSPYRTSPVAPSPDGGFRDDGYLVQRGPDPYVSGYLRGNGGTGLAWTGLTPRMHPEDFRVSRLGPGRDWPLGYSELEPHYRAAEAELGVAADVEEQRAALGLPFPDDYAFPMRAIPRGHLDRLAATAWDGRTVHEPGAAAPTELRVVGTPHARNGVPDPAHHGPAHGPGDEVGQPRCVGHASCVPVCPSGAKYTPLRTQGRWAESVTLLTRAVVGRVLAAGNGRITGVEYRRYDERGTPEPDTHHAEADLVVLAAHAIENARLLLASGLANRSDQVGRNLMDHPVLLTWGLLPRPAGPYRGPALTAGVEAFRFGPERARRAPFRVEIGNWGWSWAAGPPDLRVAELLRSGGPDGRGLLGPALRRAVGDRVGREFALSFELEQEADPANRVTIDPRHRDLLGNPRPVLTYRLSDHVKRGMAAARAVSEQLFALLGVQDRTRYAPGPDWPGCFEFEGRRYGYRAAGHAGGTHLMGTSPGNSVVDAWQRCWDHPNLYAVGCGSMPSLGTSNPSLTMAALALRSAEQINRDLLARRPTTLHHPVAVPFRGATPR